MSLYYLVQEPKIKKEKNPGIILIHGYGSNEEDLFSFAPQLQEDAYIISLRAPFNLPPYGHAWYEITFDADENKFSNNEQAIESVHKISDFIDEIIAKFPIDKENITLLGFSQGAILSYSIAFTYPKKIKNVIALSGYLNEQILPEAFDVNEMNHISFFVSHGSQDQVIPVEWARKTQPFLQKLNLPVEYNEYPVGHGVAPQNFWDFKNWLER